MRRETTGNFVKVSTVGEVFQAFVPKALPPEPEIEWNSKLQLIYEKAVLSLGRLDGIASVLPDPSLFIYSYVRKEALLSSQIEGTQSSLADIFTFEADHDVSTSFDDVKEVSNYVAALDYGVAQIRSGFPVSSRLLKEIHEKILTSGRGITKQPGEFRRSQNWIGGTKPGNARFIPPPHQEIAKCMSDLEKFIHDKPEPCPTLIKAALAHVQFETIHPFLDGNGRVGRLLITLLLCSEGLLREPMLYLSLYLKERRDDYYNLLQDVRISGDWEAWLIFFLSGINETATSATETAHALLSLFENHRQKINKLGRSGQAALHAFTVFQHRPFCSAKDINVKTGISQATVNKAIKQLQHLGIVSEVTGKRRNRLFCYQEYLKELSKGTAPLTP